MNPLGKALVAYHTGCHDAAFTLTRDDRLEQTVPVHIFFDTGSFPPLEALALEQCRGSVLDVGAAAGRHSLALQQRGFEVWSLDILPEAQQIMLDRGVLRPVVGDILSWDERSFDTVLMLMNGIGMVGTPRQLDEYLNHAHSLVAAGGQILCDSIDVSLSHTLVHVTYRENNIASGRYIGQQRFTMRYGDNVGDPFDWLHIGFESLSTHCLDAGWQCELIEQEANGHYLARIIRQSNL